MANMRGIPPRTGIKPARHYQSSRSQKNLTVITGCNGNNVFRQHKHVGNRLVSTSKTSTKGPRRLSKHCHAAADTTKSPNATMGRTISLKQFKERAAKPTVAFLNPYNIRSSGKGLRDWLHRIENAKKARVSSSSDFSAVSTHAAPVAQQPSHCSTDKVDRLGPELLLGLEPLKNRMAAVAQAAGDYFSTDSSNKESSNTEDAAGQNKPASALKHNGGSSSPLSRQASCSLSGQGACINHAATEYFSSSDPASRTSSTSSTASYHSVVSKFSTNNLPELLEPESSIGSGLTDTAKTHSTAAEVLEPVFSVSSDDSSVPMAFVFLPVKFTGKAAAVADSDASGQPAVTADKVPIGPAAALVHNVSIGSWGSFSLASGESLVLAGQVSAEGGKGSVPAIMELQLSAAEPELEVDNSASAGAAVASDTAVAADAGEAPAAEYKDETTSVDLNRNPGSPQSGFSQAGTSTAMDAIQTAPAGAPVTAPDNSGLQLQQQDSRTDAVAVAAAADSAVDAEVVGGKPASKAKKGNKLRRSCKAAWRAVCRAPDAINASMQQCFGGCMADAVKC